MKIAYLSTSNIMKTIGYFMVLAAVLGYSVASVVRSRRDSDSYDSEEVEDCVEEWENCLAQAPQLAQKAAQTNFLTAIGSIPITEACRELEDYLTCSQRNLGTCAITSTLQKELKNFANLDLLRVQICNEERSTMEELFPCITSQRVVAELLDCSEVHLTYSECDSSGFWTCVEQSMVNGCGEEAKELLDRIEDKLRVLDVGCPGL